jgi:ElaB/YqjD/DUF883 family membrane-anchored ribosome-binding protein
MEGLWREYRPAAGHATFLAADRNGRSPAMLKGEQGQSVTSGDFIMPPRQPGLPEGTDHIVAGASGNSGEGQAGTGFVASSAGQSSGTDRLVNQVKDQVSGLRAQVTDRARGFADDGKGRVTGLLDNVSEVIADAAKSVDEKLGEDYGEYAHRAASAVADFSGRIRDKSVDDIYDDTRDFVRKSPAIAIGIAAVAGFALIRVIKTGLDDAKGGSRSNSNSGRGEG